MKQSGVCQVDLLLIPYGSRNNTTLVCVPFILAVVEMTTKYLTRQRQRDPAIVVNQE